MGKISLSGEPLRSGFAEDEIMMGFDRMTDSEIMYAMDRSPYPEYMGSKVSEWLQRRKTRAKEFTKKVAAKYKKMPKWAKILTAPLAAAAALPLAAAALPAAIGLTAAAAPLAFAAAPAAPFAIAALAKKRKDAYNRMTPTQKAVEDKKRRRRIGIASAFIPGLGLTALTAAGAVKGAKLVQKRRAERLAAQRAARAVTTTVRAKNGPVEEDVTEMQAPAAMQPIPMKAVPMQQEQDDQENGAPEATEKKKSGIGAMVGLGALAALPFIFK